jgi:LacI family transcriptional regulator
MGTVRRESSESPGRRTAAATIRDVAARAGVSVATVSRALNNIGPVRDDTARRVLSAVRALRYVPHAAARSLSVRRSQTLGLLLPEVYGEFFSEVIRGIDIAARQRGYHLLVSGSHNDAEEMAAVLRALRGRVDGLIVMLPDATTGAISRSLAADTPTVLLNSAATGHQTIRIDNYAGARALTGHLTSLGHRRIAFITGPDRNADAVERRRGYRDALAEVQGRPPVPFEVPGDFTEESGYRAVPRILGLIPRPTAIFAANDAMAIGALRALREAQIPVPDGMALAGFDDIPTARYVTPPLTTVRVETAEMGRRAVEQLVTALDGGAETSRRRSAVIATTLVVRDSTGGQLEDRRAPTASRKRAGTR